MRISILIVWGYVDEGLLEKGKNSVIFIPGFPQSNEDTITDYMIASVIISNDEIMEEYPTTYFR